jgi:hypothetical protein
MRGSGHVVAGHVVAGQVNARLEHVGSGELAQGGALSAHGSGSGGCGGGLQQVEWAHAASSTGRVLHWQRVGGGRRQAGTQPAWLPCDQHCQGPNEVVDSPPWAPHQHWRGWHPRSCFGGAAAGQERTLARNSATSVGCAAW